MKPIPAPNVPGNTDWERFDNAVRKAFSVPKEVLIKEESRLKKIKAEKKIKKKHAS